MAKSLNLLSRRVSSSSKESCFMIDLKLSGVESVTRDKNSITSRQRAMKALSRCNDSRSATSTEFLILDSSLLSGMFSLASGFVPSLFRKA